MPTTIRDVAALAGVSPMTVSRVMRGDAKVSAETRTRVREAAQKLGYRRNELARNLRVGGSTGLLGLVVTNLGNPFYSRLALGVEAVAARHSLRVVLGNTGEDPRSEREMIADLVGRQVDGVIVVPAGSDHSHLTAEALGGVPVVLAARPPIGISTDCVLVDDFGGARAATAKLAAAGHRRIAFLGNPPAVYTGAERFRGFCVALEESGVGLDDRLVRRGQRETAEAEAAAAELLALDDPPTAFFCANNRNTLGALRAIHLRTGAFDGGPAVAGFDDFELADLLPVTVVGYDADEIGRRAAELLMDRLGRADADHDMPPRRVVIPTEIIT
ncbi:LacI family DNA-binding transcriptional regulator [Fodinicola acaciae]|uniref:LacI family DNA-binding transcriptional regulator n=1 Tax=Fodinicola acaciae TaxID=2681555 RepID=UPI001C9E9762|nr:LacI family DNA-binding transcriptional regulator [Fodinicola acaciae]